MIRNYFKIAWKVLLRRKFFTFVSLFGISFTLMVLMVVIALWDHTFGPTTPQLKVKNMLWINTLQLIGEKNTRTSPPSYSFLQDYVKSLKTPKAVTLFSKPIIKSAYRDTKAIEVQVNYTDETFWEVYDFSLLEGKFYGKRILENAEPVVVISERISKEFFDGTTAVGENLTLDDERYRVLGVVEDISELLGHLGKDVWMPHAVVPHKTSDLGVFGDYRAAVLAHSRQDFASIKAELHQVLQHSEMPVPKRFYSISCPLSSIEEIPIRAILGMESVENAGEIMYAVLFGGMLLFMTLPTVNLLNINVNRISERATEIGVRRAFGATKFMLIGQFITENILLTLIGGSIGGGLSFIVLDILTRSGIMPYAHFTLNRRLFVYYLLLSTFFGLFSGVYPAYKMSKVHPVEALTGGKV